MYAAISHSMLDQWCTAAMLVAKLKLIVSRKLSDEEWNLDKLLRLVEEDIVASERVSVTQTLKPRRDSKLLSSATALMSDIKGVN